MKYIHYIYSSFLLLFLGCTSTPMNKTRLNAISLTYKSFEIHTIDSTKTLNPRGIFHFDKYILLIESKNSPAFSFWSSDSLKYEFSSGYIGGGPNELIRPRTNYFAKSDSSFFILDSNIEWEIQLKDKSIHIINQIPIIIPDAINQMVHLGEGQYIMAGRTDGGNKKEHFLYTNDETISFGDYPSTDLKDERKPIFDFKFTAGLAGKKTIFDFYQYHNLIRQYSIDGKLLQEISLEDIAERHNTEYKVHHMQDLPYWGMTISTNEHIYVLFYDGATSDEIYNKGVIPELQVWDWDGNLKKRIIFDKIYNRFTVSDDGILYAMNTLEPYKIYTYDVTF